MSDSRPVPPPRTSRRMNAVGIPQRATVSPSNRRTSFSNNSGQNSLRNAEAVLKEVKKDWPALASQDFNPVPLALDLIDVSSLGKDFKAFDSLLEKFSHSVEEVVNDHYNQFNSTTTIFTGVQTEIGASQSLVHEMKAEMNRCKEILGAQRSDLNVLWSKAKQYKEMLSILDKLDEIKKVTEKLETFFRDKYYLTGIRLLLKTLTEIESEELKPIKATDELRRTLFKIKNTLHETLIEEIHNHVYLKIHLNEEFDNLLVFSNKAKFEEMISSYLNNEFDDYSLPVTPVTPVTNTNNFEIKTRTSEKAELVEDLTSDPEADSLNFLRIIVVCLKLIGKLPEALDMIKSRVPVELYQLVDKTINEIEERREKGDFSSAIHKFQDTEQFGLTKEPTSDLALLQELEEGFTSLGNSVEFSINEYQPTAINPVANEIISAFVSRLFRKFELVLGNHRFIMLLIQNISKDTKLKSPFPDEIPQSSNPTNLNKRVSRLRLSKENSVFNYNLKEVWTSMQSEIKSLLYDYITDPQLQNIAATDAISSINEALRGRFNRDLKKPLFKFSEISDPFKSNMENFGFDSATPSEKRLSSAEQNDGTKYSNDASLNSKNQNNSVLKYYNEVEKRVARSAGSNHSKKIFSLSSDNTFQIPGQETEFSNQETLLNNGSFNSQVTHTSNSHQSNALNINLASIAVDKFSLSSKLATEHRLLILPDIYNISILFPLTVSFFERAQELLLFKNEDYLNFESFLHEFFSSAFLPQMELKAQQHLFMATSGTHAFQIGYKHISSYGKPLLYCVGELLSLVKNLCTTLRLLPFQREEYIKIIENVLAAFYEKCHSCFKNAVMSNMNQPDDEHHASGTILSSTWAQSKELASLFSSHPYIQKLNQRFGFSQNLLQKAKEAMTSDTDIKAKISMPEIDPDVLEKIDKKETEIELNFKLKKSLHTSELLFDVKKLSLLATLSHSLKWFVSEVDEVIGNKETVKENEDNKTPDDNRSIKSISLSEISKGPSTIRSMAEYTNHLDKILNKFNKLSDLCLFTLRVEFRCHTMYYLDLAVREGSYYLNFDDIVSPDSYVTTLNSDLSIYEESLRKLLTEEDLNFIFDHLPTFMSRVLISIDNVQNIRKMSTKGLEKMLINISALQQNLTNMGFNNDLGLNIARDFYNLYDLDLETFSQRAQAQEVYFTQAEYKALLDLTLETLLFETSQNLQNYKPDESDQQVTELVLQSYHTQLMQLYELTSATDEV